MIPRSDYYDAPPDKWISFKYLNWIGLIKIRLSKGIRKRYKNFDSAVTLGEVAPEVDLRGDDGSRYRLSDYIGKKYVVMVFGAITWPPYRGQVPAIEQVAKKYDDVEFWHMYVREPHPQDRKFKKYFKHKGYEDRVAYAKEMREVLNISSPIVLDGMDEKIHLQYGNMPNAVYIIDKEGKVVYKANWTDTPVVDQILAQLHTEEAQVSA